MTSPDVSPPPLPRGRVGRRLAHADLEALVPYAIAGVLLAVTVIVLGRDIRHHLDAIETWVAARGPLGLVAFVALFVVATSALFPESVLSIAAGALFGLAEGAAAVLAASLVAAVLQLLLARGLLHARVQRVLAERPWLAAIQRATLRDELKLQTLLRLTPLNPASISYAMGAAGVRLPGFVLACLAMTPTLFLEVYFGYAGRHVARIAGRGAQGVLVHDVVVFAGLAACVVAVVVVSRTARRAVMAAVAEEEEA